MHGSLVGNKRSQLAECGLPNPCQFRFSFLPQKATLMILEHCSKARTPQSLAKKLKFNLDAQAIAHLLPWTCRYADKVLIDGFLATPCIRDGQEGLLAVHDKSLFASDPLLTSLLDSKISASNHTNQMKWIDCPQYDRIPIQAVREKGWIKGTYETALGIIPVPTKDRRNALIRLAKPTRSLARYRWKILQLMHWHAAVTANNLVMMTNEGNFSKEVILNLQRLALLIHDTKYLFEQDKEDSGIGHVLSDSQNTYWNVLSGDCSVKSIIPIGKMPRRRT
jgi:hypothetical protein